MNLTVAGETRQRLGARGFTLLEMLVVLAIIGLLVALVGPRLFSRVDYAKVDTAKAQIKMLRTALHTYRLDVGTFPTDSQGLKVLYSPPSNPKDRAAWHGPYLENPPPKDPWGNPYHYCVLGSGSQPFALYSLGADGKPGGSGLNADVGTLPPSGSSCGGGTGGGS